MLPGVSQDVGDRKEDNRRRQYEARDLDELSRDDVGRQQTGKKDDEKG